MGLIARIRHRVGYVWWWRLKHWWLDTRGGLHVRVALGVLAGIAGTVQIVLIVIAGRHAVSGEPHQSVIALVVWLVVALIAAIIAIAMMPKPMDQKPSQGDVPTVQDGQTVRTYFGDNWMDDSAILAWVQQGTEPIKTKGGKK